MTVRPTHGIGRVFMTLAGVYLLMAVVVVATLSLFIEHRAVGDLSRAEAQQAARLIFQAANALMRQGADKDKIEATLAEMAALRPGMTVRLHRAEIMIRDGNEAPAEEGELLSSDPELAKAVTAGDAGMLVPGDGVIRLLQPVRVRAPCVECHNRAKVGDVGGVIDITYPLSELRVSVGAVIGAVVASFALILAIFFVGLYINLRIVLGYNRANEPTIVSSTTKPLPEDR